MLEALSRSWRLLTQKQKIALTLLSLARVSINVLDLVGLALIGAIAALAMGTTLDFPWAPSSGFLEDGSFELLLTAAGLTFLLKTLAGIFLARVSFLYLARVETLLSIQLARLIFTSDLTRLRGQSTSEIEWTILRSTQKATTGLLGGAMVSAAEASSVALVFGFLLLTDWKLALAVTGYFALILALFTLASRRRVKILGTSFTTGAVDAAQAINDFTSAFREIAVLGASDFFVKAIAEPRKKLARAQALHDFLGAVPRVLVEIGLLLGALGYIGLQFVAAGVESDIPTIGIFIVASLKIMSALLPVQRTIQQIRYDAPLAFAAQEFFEELALTDSNDAADSHRTRGAHPEEPEGSVTGGIKVRIEEVGFEFHDGPGARKVLQGVSLELLPGAFVAVIGPSGSGKSTLVDLVLGLLDPSTGTVLCDGLTPQSFRTSQPESIGYVPQKPGLVSGSIQQNIALGVPESEINHDRLLEAVETAQLADFIASLPNGLSTDIGKQREGLSGGQIQRLGIARALYVRPRLLVLDEATSALDPETEAAITQCLEILRGHTTILVIAHRLSSIQNADTIHLLNNGRILASGSFENLRRNSPLVNKYADLLSLNSDKPR